MKITSILKKHPDFTVNGKHKWATHEPTGSTASMDLAATKYWIVVTILINTGYNLPGYNKIKKELGCE